MNSYQIDRMGAEYLYVRGGCEEPLSEERIEARRPKYLRYPVIKGTVSGSNPKVFVRTLILRALTLPLSTAQILEGSIGNESPETRG